MSDGGAARDVAGEEALETIGGLGRFNRWMYETIRPYCHGRLLEVGSGIGNLSQCFLDDGADLVMSDLRPGYVRRLEARFPGREVCSLDLVNPRFTTDAAGHLGRYDTVFALNVVEHIADDVLALENCRRLVRPGGTVLVLVPAYEALHNRLDVELGHFRRYTRGTLSEAFGRAGLSVSRAFHFNAVATVGWAVTGGLLARPRIPTVEATLFDRLVPAWRLVDRLLGHRVGLSVIAVGVA